MIKEIWQKKIAICIDDRIWGIWLMKKVPKRKLITVSQMRDYLTKENNADFADHMTAEIFVNMISLTSYQRNTDMTPYWRTLESDCKLNVKYPEAIELQEYKILY